MSPDEAKGRNRKVATLPRADYDGKTGRHHSSPCRNAGAFSFAQQVRALKCPGRRKQLIRAETPVSTLSVVVNAQADARRRASKEQGACIRAGVQRRPPQPYLLPQAIGRKTPDKRNRSPSAMARPASRKAVSSLPAIANIDEQLDEVVMDIHGFAAEPHKTWLASPAVESQGKVTCHDPSGFLGSWEMKAGGVFFASESNTIFDQQAMDKALHYCNEMNNKE